MAERRQVVRNEPIECEVADGRIFIAHPLPWTTANDFGNEVIRQNTEAMNEFVRMYVTDEGLPQLEMQFKQKISDWHSLLKIAYPGVPDDVWNQPEPLVTEECVQLALAACDVNHLTHLKHLIDPNSPTPTSLGGNNSSDSEGTIGQKTESTEDSASSDSVTSTPSA